MSQQPNLNYTDAFRYVAAWASFDHDDVTDGGQVSKTASLDYKSALQYVSAWASGVHGNTSELTRNPHEFFGTLGSLEFAYSENSHTLRVWSFIKPAAGPLLTRRKEIRDALDKIAETQPQETAGGTFDVRTLAWHKQAGPELDPCLWLRLDIVDATVPPSEMRKRLDHFSSTGYIWHSEKMMKTYEAYWKAHPKSAK